MSKVLTGPRYWASRARGAVGPKASKLKSCGGAGGPGGGPLMVVVVVASSQSTSQQILFPTLQ